MPKTLDTAAATYLPVSEFLKRTDVRVVADYCSDLGSRIGSSTDVAAMKSALASDLNLAALLLDATGELEQACQLGGRYSSADLLAMSAATGTAGQARLWRILSRICVALMFERRPDRELKIPEIYQNAMDTLQMLRDGERIFPFIETELAGQVETDVETPDDVENRMLTTFQARRYFGRRGNRRSQFLRE